MIERKAYLLRLDPTVLENLREWADDELRSLNAHIEFLLRRALADVDRLNLTSEPSSDTTGRG
ncbi:MAG: hypothetical protein ACE5HV_10085 [Acidobacteriota bacterium]